jgi:carboxyl-terminal processing protease
MSVRKLLTYTALQVLFALLFFATGYTIYPLLNPVQAPTPKVETANPAKDPANMQVFWEAWQLLDRDFYGAKPDSTKRVYGAIHGLTQIFQDPFTMFVEPQPRELEADDLRGSFGGIGANIEQTAQGYVLHPLRDQPAAKAGVLDGDLLLKVDEQVITQTMSADQVVTLVRGPVGTEVALLIRRKGANSNEELTFRILRAEIQTPSVEWRLLDDRPETAKIGYIHHTIFSGRSTAEMHTALSELTSKGAERIILDLRGNPGGLVDAAVQIADMWLDSGVILIEKHADGTEKTFTAQAGGEGVNLPLVVMIDGASASASEILSGALQDHQRAKLIGEKSYGKGSVQLVYELSDKSSLHVTNAQWFTPNHHQISGQGLLPDVVIEHGSDPLPQAITLVQQLTK